MLELNLADPFMKALKAVNQISAGSKTLSEDDLRHQRSSMELASKLATPPVGVSSSELSINGIPAEWSKPDFAHNRRQVIMYCHGGGYTAGGLGYARILAAKLALHTGLEVLSFEYRLAPENSYPAQIDDATAVWDYLMLQGYGADEVIVAGDSAGGNLTLELMLSLKSAGRKLPLGLILMSPWTDMTMTSDSYEQHAKDDPILSYDYIRTVRGAYVPDSAENDFASPDFSPLYGDLNGFPATLIQVGRHEILLDDSLSLYDRLNEAGCNVTLQTYEDGWHVFQQMPIPLALTAMHDISAYVDGLLY